MATCVPIRDLRDTAAFDELVEKSPTPITVTKNGYDRFVCMRSSDYEHLERAKAEADLMARMRIAEYERENGLAIDVHEAMKKLEKKYGL